MTNLIARTETQARDCDGMHYGGAEFHMEESEKVDSFGDLDFFSRVLSYVVSTGAIDGTLRITQDEDGLPIFDWSESTEEGFHACRATFHAAE